MKTIKTTLSIGLLLLTLNCHAQILDSSQKEIKAAIQNMLKGKDLQDGEMISKGFWEDAAIFATQGNNIITVPVKQFIQLHESKKFGGQDRKHEIKEIFVNESGIGSAKVIAENAQVYYEYHLGFTRKNGQWRIQTYIQHSEKK